MNNLINEVIDECSENTGVDMVFKVENHICVVCADGQSRIIDCETKEVSADTQFWCNPEDIEVIQIEDSKKSILGRKLYTLSKNGHMLKMIKTWIDLDLDSFAYSVDYDISLVDSLIDYVLLQIGRGMNPEIADYKRYLNCLFELDKEMAVAYCKGYMDTLCAVDENKDSITIEVENVLNSGQFCNLLVNYSCIVDNKVFIFFEESEHSIVYDLRTRNYHLMDSLDIQWITETQKEIKEVYIHDEKRGAFRYIMGEDISIEGIIPELSQAIVSQMLNLDEYFSSVNYDTLMCRIAIEYIIGIMNKVESSDILLKNNAVRTNKTIQKFFGYTDKRMAMAYIQGCYDCG